MTAPTERIPRPTYVSPCLLITVADDIKPSSHIRSSVTKKTMRKPRRWGGVREHTEEGAVSLNKDAQELETFVEYVNLKPPSPA